MFVHIVLTGNRILSAPRASSLKIHPTAFVDPSSEIGDDVEIGCFAVIGAGVKIGDRCIIHGHAQVLSTIEIGNNCEVGHGSVIGGAPQDLQFDSEMPSTVRIGDRNRFRENVTIHRSSVKDGVTRIGNDNFFMVGSHVGHDSVVGDHNILANHCLLGGHVQLGDGAFLGGGSAFHQFVRIGSHSMVRGLAGISQDVPPYALVSGTNEIHGLNVVGMRRAGLSPSTRKNVKAAYHKIFLAGMNLKEALESTVESDWDDEARAFIDFFRISTTRGVCHP